MASYTVTMTSNRAIRALEAVLPLDAHVEVADLQDRDAVVRLAGRRMRLRWLPVGWPRQVDEALQRKPRPDVVAAPQMSPGARERARRHGLGWVDETGAAEIEIGTILISRSGSTPKPLDTKLGWRPATLAVCEVLLTGCPATVSAVVDATGLATSTVAESLKFLDHDDLLENAAPRGPRSGRHITNVDALLDAYAAAAQRLRSPISVRVGALWRDPMSGAVEAGKLWSAANISWAVTSALSAAFFAPFLTEPTPWEIYISGRTPGDLRRLAGVAGMRKMDGGRLILRPYPTPANGEVTAKIGPGLISVLWPRAYSDLRSTGVRGEDAAEHLREEISRV